jgi:RNA polymerase sigma-70 factor (ECF subfamily)
VQYDPGSTKYGDILELLDDEVRAAIESLPEEFRHAVIMADMEDKSYKEIADVMKCPLGTVMSRLYRGRKLLREQLKDYAQSRHVLDDKG